MMILPPTHLICTFLLKQILPIPSSSQGQQLLLAPEAVLEPPVSAGFLDVQKQPAAVELLERTSLKSGRFHGDGGQPVLAASGHRAISWGYLFQRIFQIPRTRYPIETPDVNGYPWTLPDA